MIVKKHQEREKLNAAKRSSFFHNAVTFSRCAICPRRFSVHVVFDLRVKYPLRKCNPFFVPLRREREREGGEGNTSRRCHLNGKFFVVAFFRLLLFKSRGVDPECMTIKCQTRNATAQK